MEEVIGFVILSTIFIGVWYFITTEKKRAIEFTEGLKKSILKKSKTIITRNLQQLAVQRKKSIFEDAYGEINERKWLEKEIPYFMEHHIYPKLTQEELLNIFLFSGEIYDDIVNRVKEVRLPKTGYDPKMTGFQFEDFCSELLKKNGWHVRKTKPGADQGVDLIINNKNWSIGVQCKKYARPIGNKAVQEIKAGIAHYDLDRGIVLTNNKFTKSAIELAKSNNIGLIHYLEIDKIKTN